MIMSPCISSICRRNKNQHKEKGRKQHKTAQNSTKKKHLGNRKKSAEEKKKLADKQYISYNDID